MFEDTFLFALPIPVFAVGALVVLFLALAESDAQLGAALVPVQVQGNQRVALAFHGPGQAIQLMAVQQELARSRRVSRRPPRTSWKLAARRRSSASRTSRRGG